MGGMGVYLAEFNDRRACVQAEPLLTQPSAIGIEGVLFYLCYPIVASSLKL
jgi:hypothetical protein